MITVQIGTTLFASLLMFSIAVAIFTVPLADSVRSIIAWRLCGRHVERTLADLPSAVQYKMRNHESAQAWLDSLVRARGQHFWVVAVSMPAPLVMSGLLYADALLHPQTQQSYLLMYSAAAVILGGAFLSILLHTSIERRHPADSLVQRVTWALENHDRIIQGDLRRAPSREVAKLMKSLATVENTLVLYWASHILRDSSKREFGERKVSAIIDSLRSAQNDLVADFSGSHQTAVDALSGCIDLCCGLRWESIPDGDPTVVTSQLPRPLFTLGRVVKAIPPIVTAITVAVLYQLRSEGSTVAVSTLIGAAVAACGIQANALIRPLISRVGSKNQTPDDLHAHSMR